MKRTFVYLLTAAVAAWTWVAFQLVSYWWRPEGRTEAHGESTREFRARDLLPAPFDLDTALRDPFASYLHGRKPQSPPSRTVKAAAPVAIEPPRATLGGILW